MNNVAKFCILIQQDNIPISREWRDKDQIVRQMAAAVVLIGQIEKISQIGERKHRWFRRHGHKLGKLTSYTSGRKQSEHFGLGYIKRRAASEGDTVIVGDNIKGTVVEVPFLLQQRPPSGSWASCVVALIGVVEEADA